MHTGPLILKCVLCSDLYLNFMLIMCIMCNADINNLSDIRKGFSNLLIFLDSIFKKPSI